MPTYEYECLGCGKTFERFQSISAARLRRCPACHGRKVRRLISAGAGFLFRGSGFYQTDYRSEEYKAKAKAETGAPSPAGAKDATSKDSRPKDSRPKDSGSKDSGPKDSGRKDAGGKHGAKPRK